MFGSGIFHDIFIPIVAGLALTLMKLVASQKVWSFAESNDNALDLVLVSAGALGALYVDKGAVQATIDAGVGDVFFAAVLLYWRFLTTRRRVAKSHSAADTPPFSGILQLMLGLASIIWTIKAF